jgi:ATP-dependent RNA helicase RhlE
MNQGNFHRAPHGASRFKRGYASTHTTRGSFNMANRSRGGARFGGRTQRIDVSRFINKKVVTEETAPHFSPEHKFSDFVIDERLKANIRTKGYTLPTPIQDKIIPHILNGLDVVGIANTGTGKTAAFLVPLINKVLLKKGESVLVVVPTRELAIQIEEEFKDFTKGLNLYSVSCIGGANIGKQLRELRYHNDFIIGTPGRLKDLIERRALNLATFKSVVLDEADRMLDMGFINDMKYMMAKMPKERHSLFFSATVSNEIKNLIKEFLKDPVTISVKTQETAANVDQDIIRAKAGDKINILQSLLEKKEFNKVLIFGRTKHGVEKLTNALIERGFKAESIHGDKNQGRRQKALNLFKDDHVQVLVATDVAARGLDISGVSHVINFDLPATYDDYIHRIGRTGRGDKHGKALTFVE